MVFPKKPMAERARSPKQSPLVTAVRAEIEAQQRGTVAAAYERAQAGDADSASGLYFYARGLERAIAVLESVAERMSSKPMA